jgi:hypothetical protein
VRSIGGLLSNFSSGSEIQAAGFVHGKVVLVDAKKSTVMNTRIECVIVK